MSNCLERNCLDAVCYDEPAYVQRGKIGLKKASLMRGWLFQLSFSYKSVRSHGIRKNAHPSLPG